MREARESYLGVLDMLRDFQSLGDHCPMRLYISPSLGQMFTSAGLMHDDNSAFKRVYGMNLVITPSMPKDMVGIIPSDGDPKKFKLITIVGLSL